MNVIQSRGLFLNWLQKRFPDVFQRGVSGSMVTGLGADSAPASDAPPAVQADWLDRLTTTLPKLVTSYWQLRLINDNMKRAEQGKPPLDPNTSAPQVVVHAPTELTLPAQILMGTAGVVLLLFGYKLVTGKR